MAGIITGKKTLVTKNNKMMAFADMEDLYGNVEIVVFPNVYERSSALVQEDSLVVVKGSINFKEGEVPKLLANEIRDLKQASREAKMASHAPVKIRIPDSLENGLERIRDILIAGDYLSGEYRKGYENKAGSVGQRRRFVPQPGNRTDRGDKSENVEDRRRIHNEKNRSAYKRRRCSRHECRCARGCAVRN